MTDKIHKNLKTELLLLQDQKQLNNPCLDSALSDVIVNSRFRPPLKVLYRRMLGKLFALPVVGVLLKTVRVIVYKPMKSCLNFKRRN